MFTCENMIKFSQGAFLSTNNNQILHKSEETAKKGLRSPLASHREWQKK